MNEELKNVLIDNNVPVKEDKLIENEIKVKKLTYLKLRDAIWKVGRVVAELEDENIYLAAIKNGKVGNTAYLALKFLPGRVEIVGYAKEGLFNQHTTEKAIKELEKALMPDEPRDEKKNDSEEVVVPNKTKKILGIVIGILVVACISLYFMMISPAIKATNDYNKAVDEYNEMSTRYDEALKKVCVDNIEGISATAGRLEKESVELADVIQTVLDGNTANKIENDTATIYKLIDSMKDDLKVVAQIEDPSEKWVTERLKTVSMIKEVEAVSEDNDPNMMLGKDGGYTACLYFTISDIDSDSVEGATIVDKGTDVGGAIEVYKSVKDAEARCEYLSGFDNTLLYSGSYAIIGTMVIRTSYRLDGESQLELTTEITKAFTKL